MLREPYITATGLQGMKGMADHLGEDLESYKERQGPPPRRHIENSDHPKSDVSAAVGGMEGEIIEGLLDYTLSRAGKDPAITQALKDLLMIARLSAPDTFMEPYYAALNKRTDRRRMWDEDHQKRMKDWTDSQRRTEENYHRTESELKTRWAKVLKSLRAAVKKDPDIRTMALVDQQVFAYLNKKGFVTIRKHIILDVDTRLDVAGNGLILDIITKMGLIEAEVTVDRW